ncbi:ASCH domain-containing protein [Ornithinicoccus halotolerans]|uniref:ASCH domain-containing protein n=1 Tax=Ornithinicoccus halotolerans TaxID=1748220 RepID=UPI001294C624|nr:ASCH domain-containing protein [Ornithinicoccus halotolerans]
MSRTEIDAFWENARVRAGLNPARAHLGPTVTETVPPPAWCYGDTAEEADRFVELVLEGRASALTSARSDFGDEDELPQPGDLAILLDSAGRPRALLATTAVRVAAVGEVGAEHLTAEGVEAPDLPAWRAGHGEGVRLVLERFRVLVPPGVGSHRSRSVPTR